MGNDKLSRLFEISEKLCRTRSAYIQAVNEYNRQVEACGDMGSNVGVDRYAPRRRQDELHGLEQEALKLVYSLSEPSPGGTK